MSFCSNCGNDVGNSNFCNVCGEPTSNRQSSTRSSNTRRVEYEGTVYKCPNCGEVLPAFTARCPACGFEIRDGSSSESTKKLYSELKLAASDEERINLVKMFPIPNSKEDIMEFMITAVSNFDAEYYALNENESSLASAWMTKIEQCYQKAKVVLVYTPYFAGIENAYNDVKLKIKKAKSARKKKKVLGVFLIVIGVFLCMISYPPLVAIGVTLLVVGIIFVSKKKKTETKQAVTASVAREDSITMAPVKKTGFASWHVVGKIWWIILNIYTFGIPAIIYSRRRK